MSKGSHQRGTESQQQRRKLLPSLTRTVAAGAFVQLKDMANAVTYDEFAQLDAMAGLTVEDLVEGMVNNMAQDGVIRIPLKKERTDFLSQIYAEADPVAWAADPKDAINLPQAQTFDLNDPDQLAQAIS